MKCALAFACTTCLALLREPSYFLRLNTTVLMPIPFFVGVYAYVRVSVCV